jgi:hypothetical protein
MIAAGTPLSRSAASATSAIESKFLTMQARLFPDICGNKYKRAVSKSCAIVMGWL